MLAVAAAVTVSVLLVPTPAAAHGQLAYSDPANESTVTDARTQVALYFTEKPADKAFFAIISPNGIRVDQGWSHGEPKQLDKPIQELVMTGGTGQPQMFSAGFPAMVAVSHWPEKGVYAIRYVSVASDGDRVQGEIRFDYQGATTAAPAGWQQPSNEPDPSLTGAAPPPADQTAIPTPATEPAAKGKGLGPIWVALIMVAGMVVLLLLLRRKEKRP
jgi:methionine-rich copper-binding protein CopC